MTLESIAIFVPLLFFAWRALISKNPVSNIVVGLYAYPFYAITAISGGRFSIPGMTISVDLANSLRAAVHVFVFIALFVIFSVTRPNLQIPRCVIWGFITLMAMSFSALVNGAEPSAVARIAAAGVVVVNTLILVPCLAAREDYFRVVGTGCILMAVYLSIFSVYVLWIHGPVLESSLRLGRPLNPGVLSFLLATATIVSFLTNVGILVRALLGVGLLFCASRLDMGLVLSGYLIMAILVRGWRFKMLAVALATATIFLVLLSSKPIGANNRLGMLFLRDDFYSGRLGTWTASINDIRQSPWFGMGDRAYVDRTYVENYIGRTIGLGGDVPKRAHNMLLEIAASYGIPVVFLAFGLYASIASSVNRLRKTPGGRRYALVGLSIVGLAFAHTIFDTSFWTNLGDGTSILILCIAGPLAFLGERVTVRARPLVKQTPRLRRFRRQIVPAYGLEQHSK